MRLDPRDYGRIPPAIRAGLDRYAEHGLRGGNTLHAILCGDLFGAFARADPETQAAMPAIVAYVVNDFFAPYGSAASVEAWIAQHTRRRSGAL